MIPLHGIPTHTRSVQKPFAIPKVGDGRLLASTVLFQPNSVTGLTSGPVLLDLPNEVILLILEDVPDELYSLALLCRRLHHLALPLYLARHGMSPFAGELILYNDQSEEILQGVTIALFQPALKCVSCTFDLSKSAGDISRKIRGVMRLLAKLAYLGEAHLDFVHEGATTACGQLTESQAKEFETLFSAIVHNPGCITFTVCLAGRMVASTPAELSALFRRRYAGDILRHLVDCTGLSSITQRLTSRLFQRNATSRILMETFNMHSAILFHVFLCGWTIGTLNTASLTTLSLRHLDLHPDAWATILPHITMPALSSLSIDLCSITSRDMSKFLQRHPQIQDLYLGRSLPSPHVMDQLQTTALPLLTHLSATTEYLIHLLIPGSLPNLTFVGIISRIRHGQHFDFGVINHTLLPISDRLQQTRISLKVSFESSSHGWMDPFENTDHHNRSLLPYVMDLELQVVAYRLPLSVISNLPRWLSSFSSLQRLTFLTLSPSGPVEPYQIAPFLRSIIGRCPGIETIRINDLDQNIGTWLSGDPV